MSPLPQLSGPRAFLLAVVLKLVVLLPLLYAAEHWPFGAEDLAFTSGDTESYLQPLDELLEHGEYRPDLRMPGYGVLYVPTRLLFTKEAALPALVLLQILLAAAAAVALMRTAKALGMRDAIATAAFLITALGLWTNYYDLWILSESACISAVILGIWCFVRRRGKWHARDLLAAGAFFTWAIFLRPVCALFVIIAVVAILFDRSLQFIARVKTALIFSLPLLLAEVPWTIRNAAVNDHFAPLSNGIFMGAAGATPKYHVLRMLMQMGGDVVWWGEPDADTRWFNVTPAFDADGARLPAAGGKEPQPWWTSSRCPMDSLRSIALLNIVAQDPARSSAERSAAETRIAQRCLECTEGFVREHPFAHQIRSRLRHLKNFTVHSGSPYAFPLRFSEMPLWMKALKLGCFLLYAFVIFGGLIAAVWIIARGSGIADRTVAFCCLLGVLSIPFGMRLSDPRYLAPLWPLATLCALLLVDRTLRTRRMTT